MRGMPRNINKIMHPNKTNHATVTRVQMSGTNGPTSLLRCRRAFSLSEEPTVDETRYYW